jgi:hypothetical protein
VSNAHLALIERVECAFSILWPVRRPLIAKALGKLVDVVLRRLHFDHLADRGVVGDALRRSNTDATALIAKIVYYAILLIALQMAFGVFGPNPISAVLNSIVAWLPKLIVAIIIVVLASAIAKVVKDLITDAIGGLTYGRFLASLASVVIIAIGVVAALTQIGIASAITLPILYIALITVGATIAIGVGGGLIRPMQSRWERASSSRPRTRRTPRSPPTRRAGPTRCARRRRRRPSRFRRRCLPRRNPAPSRDRRSDSHAIHFIYP